MSQPSAINRLVLARAGSDEWQRLVGKALDRLRGPHNPSTRGTTGSAIAKLRQFQQGPARGRELFRQPRFAGDIEVSNYNEFSLLTFAEWLTVHKSRKTGKPIAVSTMESYISLIKSELGVVFGVAPVIEGGKRLSRVLRHIASTSPTTDRKRRRGLRRRHLRRAYREMGFRRDLSAGSVNKWASLVVAWEALARGGEVTWSGGVGPTRADVTFEEDKHGRTATLWLRPLKKRGKARAAKVPIVFAAADGGGDDTYRALRRLFYYDAVPAGRQATTPLFRRDDGSPFSPSYFRTLVKAVAKALGFDPADFGGHSPRIGGATDIGDRNPLMLQAKGRWAGDVARIYNRLTRRGLIKASRAMHARGATDMEEIYSTFAQPA